MRGIDFVKGMVLLLILVPARCCHAQIKVVRKPAPQVDADHYVTYEWWTSWGTRDDKDYPLGINKYHSLGEARSAAQKGIDGTRENGSFAITHFLIEGEPDVKEKAEASKVRKLGRLSEKYEVGMHGSRTISTGKITRKDKTTGKVLRKDDPGGISYGSYQLASKRGIGESSVTAFVMNYYPDDFTSLKAGTKDFNERWGKVVDRELEAFRDYEWQFIKDTHYDPVAKALQEKLGLDLDTRSQALRDVIWSTAVQHGPPEDPKGHAVEVLMMAFDQLSGRAKFDLSKVSDEQIISAIYAERGRKGPDGHLVHFPTLTDLDRFDKEDADALRELKEEQSPPERSTPLP